MLAYDRLELYQACGQKPLLCVCRSDECMPVKKMIAKVLVIDVLDFSSKSTIYRIALHKTI